MVARTTTGSLFTVAVTEPLQVPQCPYLVGKQLYAEIANNLGGTTTRIAPIALLLTVFVASATNAQIAGERAVSTPIYGPATFVGGSAIASDGTQFLAVWIDGRDRYAVYAARIDRDGTVLDPMGILIGFPDTTLPVGVAWNGDSYVVIWQRSNTVMAARIAPDGRIVDPPHVIVGAAQIYSANQIAANGNVSVVMTSRGYFVLDHELRIIDSGSFGSSASNVVSVASVNLTGAGEFALIASGGNLRLDSSGHYVSLGNPAGPVGGAISCHSQNCIRVFGNGTTHLNVASYDPIAQTTGPPLELSIVDGRFAVVAIANGYLLATSDSIQRFDMQGRPLGPPISQRGQPGSAIAATSNGRDAALLRSTGGTLSVAIVTPSAAGEPRDVATSANAQQRPAIAGSGSSYLVAWAEKDGLYAGRLSLDGTPLDGRGRLLSTLTEATSVAFDGASYFVAAGTPDHPGSTTIVRIDPLTGATLAEQTICGDDMRIASNRSTRVAVWTDCADRVAAAFLDANGAFLSMPVTLTPPAGGWVAHPSLAWNGALWLVTWEEQYHPVPPSHIFGAISLAIRGARLSAALTPLDTTAITIKENEWGFADSSRLASDGHDFLAVWTSNDSFVHARRISASGEALDDERLFRGSGQDLIWDGAQYVLAFSTSPYYAPADLAVAHLRPSGQAFETFVISATPDDERSASLVSLGNGRVVAAYTRVAHEPLYGGVERAFIAAPRPARGRAVRKEMQ